MNINQPKMTAEIQITEAGKPAINYTFEGEMSKEHMDECMTVLEDGVARVTVSADFSTKNFGNGVSSMCSVSLSCGQNETTITRAYEIASKMARKFAVHNRSLAQAEMDQLPKNK